MGAGGGASGRAVVTNGRRCVVVVEARQSRDDETAIG